MVRMYLVAILATLSTLTAATLVEPPEDLSPFAATVMNLIPPELFEKFFDTSLTPEQAYVEYGTATKICAKEMADFDVPEDTIQRLKIAVWKAFQKEFNSLTFFQSVINVMEDYFRYKLGPDIDLKKIDELAHSNLKFLEQEIEKVLNGAPLNIPFLHVLCKANANFLKSLGETTADDAIYAIETFTKIVDRL